MKDPRVILSIVASLVLGVLLFAEKQGSAELQRQLALVQASNQAQLDEAARTQAELKDLQRLLAELRQAQSAAPSTEIASAESKDEAAAEAGKADDKKKGMGGFGKMLEKMFTDPEMKKVMKSQQSMAVKMMYGDLAKELGLGPEEARQVMDLLADRQMALAGKGMKLLGGEKTDGQTAEDVAAETQASQQEYDKQLENLLGKDGFAKFGEYERTMGDRMQITQYKQAFTANGVPLEDTQSQGLLNIMKEERLKQPPSPLEPGNKDVGAALKAMQSDDAFDSAMANQETLNRRVLDRSRSVLTPDQVVQFEQIQKSQLDMQKMGMKMGREMLKGK